MVAESVGPSAEEFLDKVRQATARPPWFRNMSGLVCLCTCAAISHSACLYLWQTNVDWWLKFPSLLYTLRYLLGEPPAKTGKAQRWGRLKVRPSRPTQPQCNKGRSYLFLRFDNNTYNIPPTVRCKSPQCDIYWASHWYEGMPSPGSPISSNLHTNKEELSVKRFACLKFKLLSNATIGSF